MKTLHEEMTPQFYIWVGFEEDESYMKYYHYTFLLSGIKKVKGGVQHLVKRYQRFDLNLCYADIANEGIFSKRPYQLAQVSDGSIDNCVLALYYQFCQAKQLEPTKLLNLAYPEEKEDHIDFERIHEFADWEGVALSKKVDYNSI